MGITRGLHHLHQLGIECRELTTSSIIMVPYDNQYEEYQYRVKICLMKNYRQLEYHNPEFIESDLKIGESLSGMTHSGMTHF